MIMDESDCTRPLVLQQPPCTQDNCAVLALPLPATCLPGAWHVCSWCGSSSSSSPLAAFFCLCLQPLREVRPLLLPQEAAGGALQVQAERNLIAAGLRDPSVEWFVLLSESCIPLYSAQVVWAQLISQQLSRINACADWDNPEEVQRIMAYRYMSCVDFRATRLV